MSDEINLNFSRFYTVADFQREEFANNPKIPAIYIWGWKNAERMFKPYYVGKTFHLYERILQHLGSLNGGLYSIYHKDYFLSDDFKGLLAADNNKLLYRPDGISAFSSFFKEHVQQNVKWMIENFTICWAQTDPALNAGLEKLVAEIIGKDQLGSTIKGKSLINPAQVSFSGNPEIASFLTAKQKVLLSLLQKSVI